MRARLFCQVGKLKGQRFEFAEEATIGRHPDNSIVLTPASLSSRHARIRYDREIDTYQLEDLASMNGTRLDGQRVTVPEPLGHLHVITFAGKHDFIFQDLERCAARHPPAEGAPSALPPPVFAAAGQPRDKTVIESKAATLPPAFSPGPALGDRPEEERTRLEEIPLPLPAGLGGAPKRPPEEKTRIEQLPPMVPTALARPQDKEAIIETADNLEDAVDLLLNRSQSDKASAGAAEASAAPEPGKAVFFLELMVEGGTRRVELEEGENLVGRDPAARIRPENPDISRRHATLVLRDGQVALRDEGSRNHTYVNGEKLKSEVEVRPGAQLRFGSAKALLVVEAKQQDGG